MEELITDYRFELVEAGCAPGSGFYSLRVSLTRDISPVFPYLNAVLEDTWYDQKNRVIIGTEEGQRFAFRDTDIRVAGVPSGAEAPRIAREVVARVNQIWQERDRISPCFSERKLPAVIDIYRLLPKTNCQQCGYVTCLVFASELRTDCELLARCSPLSQPEYARSREQLESLFSSD